MIDLMAYSAVNQETEVSYIRKERDWLSRAVEQGRFIDQGRMLPVLPASVAANGPGGHAGNGHNPKVVGLSAYSDRRFTLEMLNAGASGFWVVSRFVTTDAANIPVARGWTADYIRLRFDACKQS